MGPERRGRGCRRGEDVERKRVGREREKKDREGIGEGEGEGEGV